MVDCMIDACTRDPTERVTVNEGGMRIVYAVCVEHKRTILNGASFTEPTDASRGLLGIEER